MGLLDKAANACLAAKSHLLVFGDFNYPEIDYASSAVNSGSGTDAHAFFNKTNDLLLYQNIYDWTRHRSGQQPSLLDYVFTDEDNVIDKYSFRHPWVKVTMSVLNSAIFEDNRCMESQKQSSTIGRETMLV